MSKRPRPPILHLTGDAVSCCGGRVLIDCSGTYKCPCGKDREERARKILAAIATADWIARQRLGDAS